MIKLSGDELAPSPAVEFQSMAIGASEDKADPTAALRRKRERVCKHLSWIALKSVVGGKGNWPGKHLNTQLTLGSKGHDLRSRSEVTGDTPVSTRNSLQHIQRNCYHANKKC